ncbi:DNA recombination protein RmuC [Aestuariimicrobium sp. Y1814]|uniref:DNA recombination protein RmuC n=1 Tax=Aestuariimicrobium sp. Y1814 TaxID=3418742 RepID=UPI003DA6FF88
MTSASLVLLLTGLVVGALGTWLVARSRGQADLHEARAGAERARAETAQVRAELATQRELLAQHRTEAANADADRAEHQAMVSQARTEAAEAKADLAGAIAQRDAARAQVAAISADQQRMTDQFKLLSAEQLEQQGRTADAAAAERQKAVEAVVTPLTQQLAEFQQKITLMERERTALTTELREQVKLVSATGDQVRRETHALATALRKPQVRGQWGELQLKRLVEFSGLVENIHFVTQATTTTSAETTIRPDMTILLGDGKQVHVDSKVPLSAFLDAHESESEVEREQRLVQFTRNVRTHIDQLADKKYWSSEVATPEFVIMFIPMESLYAEAMHRMPDLFEHATARGIVLANPGSLIALLKTVAHSWRQAELAENAGKVLSLARELHDRLATMGANIDKLGRALGSTVKAYNASVGSLEARVLPTARKLNDLHVTEAALESPSRVDAEVRPLTAPELEMRRPDPSLAELVEDTTPARTAHLRQLG